MSQLFRFPNAVKRDPSIAAWMRQHPGELGEIARQWFEVMRQCGADVREILHDGHPTACVGDAAFAYVNAFKAHVNVGFFRGAALADPQHLLEGTGKSMRHVKLSPARALDAPALSRHAGPRAGGAAARQPRSSIAWETGLNRRPRRRTRQKP